jgi:hypothetical protein
MLHVDIIAMIPKEVDLLQILVDEAKVNSLLKASKGIFFLAKQGQTKVPF